MTDRTGRCMCGAVTIAATGMSDEFSDCHCQMCQRWTGSSFKGVSVPTDNLTITGRDNITVIDSSDFAERAHCSLCGSPIWWRLTTGKYVGNTSISLGLLDDTGGLSLGTEYFPENKNSGDGWLKARKQFSGAQVDEMIADFMGGDQP